MCGFCRQSFKRLDQWIEHKQSQWCKTSFRLSRSLSQQQQEMVAQQQEMVALAASSIHDGGGEGSDLHRPYRLSASTDGERLPLDTRGKLIDDPSTRVGLGLPCSDDNMYQGYYIHGMVWVRVLPITQGGGGVAPIKLSRWICVEQIIIYAASPGGYEDHIVKK